MEEALDLLSDRILNECIRIISIPACEAVKIKWNFFVCVCVCVYWQHLFFHHLVFKFGAEDKT